MFIVILYKYLYDNELLVVPVWHAYLEKGKYIEHNTSYSSVPNGV